MNGERAKELGDKYLKTKDMAQVGYRKIEKTFEIDYGGNIIKCEEGKFIIAIPECDTDTEYMVAYEHSPFRMAKEYFSDRLYGINKVLDEVNWDYSKLI